MVSDFPDDAAGNAGCEGVGWDVVKDDGAGPDDGIFPDGDAGADRDIRPQPYPVFNDGRY